MEPPLLPLPPRSPAEGREGSAPRQDPPLRPPPATSTPSLAPSLTLRALPLNRSESAKEGETGKKSPRPCPARRRSGRCGEERGGAAAAATGHRPRLGLTVAVRARQGHQAETGSAPAAIPAHDGPARHGASPTRGLWTFGSSCERQGSLTLERSVISSPVLMGDVATVWSCKPPPRTKGPLQRLSQGSH